MPTVLDFALSHLHDLCKRTFGQAQRNTDLCLTGTHTHAPVTTQCSASNASHWLGLQKSCSETTVHAALCVSAVVSFIVVMVAGTFVISDEMTFRQQQQHGANLVSMCMFTLPSARMRVVKCDGSQNVLYKQQLSVTILF